MTSSLSMLFERDLDKLTKEVSQYSSESIMWITKKEISNSAGNLAIHLTGNLQHYIGATLGNTGYKRDRPFEFHGKNVPREKIISDIEHTKKVIKKVFTDMKQAQLKDPYPIQVFGFEMTNEFFMMHLLGHLNYHLGQINYHRRLLDQG